MRTPGRYRRRRRRGGHPRAGACLPSGTSAVAAWSSSSAIPAPRGASVRNFGMLWPIGQPFGAMRDLAHAEPGDLARGPGGQRSSGTIAAGSLHLAYHEDEAQVLREFAEQSLRPRRTASDLLDPGRRSRRGAGRAPGRAASSALWSPTEVCVDPREVVADLPEWLAERFGVAFRFDAPVVDVGTNRVTAAASWIEADRVWVCSGDEMRMLFPGLLRAERAGPLQAPDDAVAADRRRVADRSDARRRPDAPPLRGVPGLSVARRV